MSGFRIFTDSTADLPLDYIKENNLNVFSFCYSIDEKEYGGIEEEMEPGMFYDRMRNGSMPVTSQVNPDVYLNAFSKFMEESDEAILYIGFSSGLSGSYNNSVIASNELKERYPNKKIYVFDSLCASMGQGLIVHKAVMLQKEGKSFEEVIEWLEGNKLNICHDVTVDDLFHLNRGGRVSKMAALFGTMVNIKPVLHVDNEGHLTVVNKIRGRKKSLHHLVDTMEKQMGSRRDNNDIVFISHGDCLEDAQYVAKLIKEKFGIKNFMINVIGPTVGAHAGPGTIALFYEGDNR